MRTSLWPLHVPVLASGDGFVVVAKPAGIVVHRNEWSSASQLALLQLVRDQVGYQVNPVHRLDAGTSGCLIFAADTSTTAYLQEPIDRSVQPQRFDRQSCVALAGGAAMHSERAQKMYYAFCRGDAAWLQQHTEAPLPRQRRWLLASAAEWRLDRSIKDDKGILREAQTHLHCVGACDDDAIPPAIGERSSLVVARPATGRWHQIRKHVNGLSHPVLNDAKHGDSRVNRWWRAQRGLQGLGLHCAEISLPLPDGEMLHVSCPVRSDLLHVWRQLPWWEQARGQLSLLDEEDPWEEESRETLAHMLQEADAKAQRKRGKSDGRRSSSPPGGGTHDGVTPMSDAVL